MRERSPGTAAADDPTWAVRLEGRLVRALHFTPDGSRLLMVAGSDAENVARELWWWSAEGGVAGPLETPDWVLDGLPLATGDGAVLSAGDALHVLRDGTAVRVPFGESSAYELAGDASMRWVVGAFDRGPGGILADLDAGVSEPLKLAQGEERWMFPRAAMSADGERACVSAGFANTSVVDTRSGEAVKLPSPDEADVLASGDSTGAGIRELLPAIGAVSRRVWLSASGDLLVVAGMIPYRMYASSMCLWVVDLSDPTSPGRLVNIDSTFGGVDLSADRQICVACSGEVRESISFWAVNSGALLWTGAAGVDNVSDLRISSDGSKLAIVGGGQVLIRSLSMERVGPDGEASDTWRVGVGGVPGA